MTVSVPTNGTALTPSTATIELENSFSLSPGVSSPIFIRDQMGRVAKLTEESKLPKFTYACAPSGTQWDSFNGTLKTGEPRGVIRRSSIFYRPELTLPLGWEQHIHPEGSPYFVYCHTEGNQIRKIVTEEWMYDPKICTLVLNFIKQIEDAISDQELILWPESDLFLELRRDQTESIESQDGHVYCGYYFVHNPRRRIYWPDNVALERSNSKTLNSNLGELSECQSKLCLEAEYWTHWNRFPSLQSISPEIYDYVVATIMCVMTNLMAAPHDANNDLTYEELQKTLKLIRTGKDNDMSGWHIGRFMMCLTQGRLRNCCGALDTGLDGTQSVVKCEYAPHSMVVKILSPFFFFIPHAQLEHAGTLVTDRYPMSLQWKHFLDKIQGEWIRTALLATVILAANCAFLAIPVFQETTRVVHNFLEQVCSYVSLATCLFGIILALVFYRRHKTEESTLPGDLIAYLHESNDGNIDYKRFEHLLLLWSLPHALVAWSALAFLLAFLSMCMSGTFTLTKVVIGFPITTLGWSTVYYLFKHGGGSKLFQIWLGRVHRTMSRPLRLSDQGGEFFPYLVGGADLKTRGTDKCIVAETSRNPGCATSTPDPSLIHTACDK